jgi:hypothetical protein
VAIAGQADWGAGIYRGREAPENAAYDLLNCLLDDEGQPFRRGGSAYKSNANHGSTLLGLWDGQTSAGGRTVSWGSAALYTLSGDDATPVTLAVTATAAVP